jgi:uncharacterized protein (DUF1800 family)
MGNYLNTAGNQKEDPATGRLPDENYAREVMQLFTIGLHELHADGSRGWTATASRSRPTPRTRDAAGARVHRLEPQRRRSSSNGPELMRKPMVLNAALHSTLAVSFLGTTMPAGTDGTAALRMALDTLARMPTSAPSSAAS